MMIITIFTITIVNVIIITSFVVEIGMGIAKTLCNFDFFSFPFFFFSFFRFCLFCFFFFLEYSNLKQHL